MKNIACLAAILLAGGVFIANARADDPASQTLSATDRLSLQDPDGTPLIVSHPEAKQPSPAEIEAARKSAQQAASNQDWLLRAYEEQLQQKNAGVPGSQNNNLYYRIASDKNLSKLAGVSPIDATAETDSTSRTGAPAGSPAAPAPTQPTSSTTASFAPLITPLGAADAAGLHNFYSTLPVVVAPKKADVDPADLDMPGKIAADSNPLTKESLTFDSLPDDTSPDKASNQETSKLELPTSNTSEQVQKLTNAALTAPGTVKTVTPVNISALQLKLFADPPSPKLVAPTPVRPAIANPFSILDR